MCSFVCLAAYLAMYQETIVTQVQFPPDKCNYKVLYVCFLVLVRVLQLVARYRARPRIRDWPQAASARVFSGVVMLAGALRSQIVGPGRYGPLTRDLTGERVRACCNTYPPTHPTDTRVFDCHKDLSPRIIHSPETVVGLSG